MQKNEYCVNANFMQNNQINYHHDDCIEIQNILSPKSSKERIVHDLFYNNKMKSKIIQIIKMNPIIIMILMII